MTPTLERVAYLVSIRPVIDPVSKRWMVPEEQQPGCPLASTYTHKCCTHRSQTIIEIQAHEQFTVPKLMSGLQTLLGHWLSWETTLRSPAWTQSLTASPQPPLLHLPNLLPHTPLLPCTWRKRIRVQYVLLLFADLRTFAKFTLSCFTGHCFHRQLCSVMSLNEPG